jgi:hypothetical protein
MQISEIRAEKIWDMYLAARKRYPLFIGISMKTEVAMDLHLEKKEASLAFRILKNRMGELRTEVRHDKDSSVRDYLKNEERILKNILAKFSGMEGETRIH